MVDTFSLLELNPTVIPSKVRGPKSRDAQPTKRNPSGSFTGGSCDGCGKPLSYWIRYKLCESCLKIPEGAITRA